MTRRLSKIMNQRMKRSESVKMIRAEEEGASKQRKCEGIWWDGSRRSDEQQVRGLKNRNLIFEKKNLFEFHV